MRVVEINGKVRYCIFYRSFEFNYDNFQDLERKGKIIEEKVKKEIRNNYLDVFLIFTTKLITTLLSGNNVKCEFCIYSENEQVFL